MVDSILTNLRVSDVKLDESNLLDTNQKVFKLDRDNTCGYFCLARSILQRLANAKIFVVIYGLSGTTIIASAAYFNGTITTIEKRYGIPSQISGVIAIGLEITSVFMSPILGQLLTTSHRPRWVAVTVLLSGLYCFLNTFLHVFTGSGENALSLTLEYGTTFYDNGKSDMELGDSQISNLCQHNKTASNACISTNEFGFGPPLYLFIAQLMVGMYGNVYDCLGTAFIDDNLTKAEAPAYLSFAFFLRMLGPTVGYTVALLSLKLYISPDLTPIITPNDPRWLGAWWMGWIILGAISVLLAFLLSLFPRELPSTTMRRKILENVETRDSSQISQPKIKKSLISELLKSYKKFFANKIILYNLFSGILHIFGALPFWVFAPKYIETQYKQSASTANLLTGTVGLLCTALGVLLAGFILKRFKLHARQMAFWNLTIGITSCCIMFAYIYLGCKENENSTILTQSVGVNGNETCISDCNCDFVNFNPVCGENRKTYISPCHAGCTQETLTKNGTIVYANCSCINSINDSEGFATPGSCSVNCDTELLYFMILMCLNNLLIASARTNSILITVRSINPIDKSIMLTLGFSFTSVLALIPSPIFFGWIFDQSCIFWKKSCSGTGNCWLYDSESMRYYICFVAAGVIAIGTIMDFGAFQSVKNVIMVDNDENVLRKTENSVKLDMMPMSRRDSDDDD